MVSRQEGRRGRRGMESVMGKEVFPTRGEAIGKFPNQEQKTESGRMRMPSTTQESEGGQAERPLGEGGDWHRVGKRKCSQRAAIRSHESRSQEPMTNKRRISMPSKTRRAEGEKVWETTGKAPRMKRRVGE